MISISEVKQIALSNYGITVEAKKLPGYEDENYKLTTLSDDSFILKIYRAEESAAFLKFQNAALQHLASKKPSIHLPKVITNSDGNLLSSIPSENQKRVVRLLSWVEGRLWAKVNPKTESLRYQLGMQAGILTKALLDFTHPEADRVFDWDLANVSWTQEHLHLFSSEEKKIVSHFQQLYQQLQNTYQSLPKSIVHNDVNDYNILVSEDLKTPKVSGIIDFGDLIRTQTVNDLAIVLAYAIMDVPDPLEASLDVLKGYNEQYNFSEGELKCLYVLTGMRLVNSMTKAAIHKVADPSSAYHVISAKPAWEVLKKWYQVPAEFAEFSFRNACGFPAHPNELAFANWTEEQTVNFSDLFPTEKKEAIYLLDMKPSSRWMGSRNEFNNIELFEYKINQLQKENLTRLIANGYLEPRPVYTSSAYDKEGNNGPESRTVHLGVDFWLPKGTPVHALFDAEVFTAVNDKGHKEYGGLIILKHHENDLTFFTLHGHLTAESPSKFKVGDRVKKGECFGYLGSKNENGEWSPHLHFQIILSMLDFQIDFPGVTYPNQVSVWKSVCPDPNLLFKNKDLITAYDTPSDEILAFRGEHLGKGLSISYEEPLHIVRGDGVYLLDTFGRKYLDTVNNVAHVGHEHPQVVQAGQKQMALLNTNTRYLNDEIIKYAKTLLKKLPSQLSVLHFVNSGSEANELAIRMAKTVTGRPDMLAIEIGYHGNTNAVIEVSSYKFDGKGGKGKPKNTHILPMPDSYRGMFQGQDSGMEYASHAKKMIDSLPLKGKEIAAFIAESILSCGGQIVPQKGYFKEVYAQVRELGGLCIADEVQTGFGRVGIEFWAFQLHDVVPDILTIGKPAGNGHPLAVVACTQEIAAKFANGMEFFNTFGGNPVSCKIGRTVLEVIEVENLQQNALKVGGFLKSELLKLQGQFPIIGEVRGEGLFLGFELVNSEKKPLAQHATYLANRMRDLKILMSTDGPDYNVLKIKPPMVFSTENAKELIFRLKQVFAEDFMLHF